MLEEDVECKRNWSAKIAGGAEVAIKDLMASMRYLQFQSLSPISASPVLQKGADKMWIFFFAGWQTSEEMGKYEPGVHQPAHSGAQGQTDL